MCGALRRASRASMFLDGQGGFDDDWGGPLVAISPRRVHVSRRAACGPSARGDPLGVLERLLRERRAAGGGPNTGLAAVLAYDLLDPQPVVERDRDRLPELAILAVDASVRFRAGQPARLSVSGGRPPEQQPDRLRSWVESLERPADLGDHRPTRVRARTSLPRTRYLDAVRAVQRHIRLGDIYQANLCQQLRVEHSGDPFELYRRLVRRTPAPRSAFVDMGDWALASVSPETFLRVTKDGEVETRPIKGTRPRGSSPDEDHRNAQALLASDKDRAELLMIVDLERNDLGRVAETGSVQVPEAVGLQSYAAVHHLVARVVARLRSGVGTAELLEATFPGGSITGAPKLRVMRILRRLEPVRRNFFTGSLAWFGDDGSMESSILIRSVVTAQGRALVGAGGGVVADSDPEQEWLESNHKARALAEVLGFEPEEAT